MPEGVDIMSNYKNILVAIDINANFDSVIQKALTICESPNDLSLVYIPLTAIYIQPYMYGLDYNSLDDVERTNQARDKLKTIATEYGIDHDNVHIQAGDAADEIKEIASEIDADLIVIGTHGRSGIKLLLGSTANAVLHGVKQDVLAVRIQD
jgi:universal stress protein A